MLRRLALALIYWRREQNGRVYSPRRIARRQFRYCRRFVWHQFHTGGIGRFIP